MRAVLQRVSQASVTVEKRNISQIKTGLLILLGVEKGDTEQDANSLADKITNLRIFEDHAGKMNLALKEINGEALIVSQFTLLADCRKGRRPGFSQAAPPAEARRLYEFFADRLTQKGVRTSRGKFQADMQVSLINDGPVTMLLDSRA